MNKCQEVTQEQIYRIAEKFYDQLKKSEIEIAGLESKINIMWKILAILIAAFLASIGFNI